LSLIRVGNIVFDPEQVLINLDPDDSPLNHCVELWALQKGEDSAKIYTFYEDEANALATFLIANATDVLGQNEVSNQIAKQDFMGVPLSLLALEEEEEEEEELTELEQDRREVLWNYQR